MSLHLQIITPDSTVFDGQAASVTLPTMEGEITVLPEHIPLVGILRPGSVLVRDGKEELLFAVSRGIIEIDGSTVRVLADTADRAEDLEESAIEQAKERAQQLLTERRSDAEGFAEATGLLERELARLQVVRRHRSRRGFGSPGSNS